MPIQTHLNYCKTQGKTAIITNEKMKCHTNSICSTLAFTFSESYGVSFMDGNSNTFAYIAPAMDRIF